MSTAWLKPGREKSLFRGHPWIFSSALEKVELSRGVNPIGETIDVLTRQGEFLARGAYSPVSQIRIRVWTKDEAESISEEFFRKRIEACRHLRENIIQLSDTDAIRLVHGESDGLPGLIVDRYAHTIVIQCLNAGIEKWRDVIVRCLIDQVECDRVYERSDTDVRKLEGLEERAGLLHGSEPPVSIEIQEAGIRYLVDIRRGQKTGFYLDQRANRSIIKELARDRSVLDCFAYSGSFTVAALCGGALRVTAIDSSAAALDLARKNLTLNSLPDDSAELKVGDVFRELRELRDRGEKYDLIILDPPKFAPTITQAQQASRAYKDINLLSLKLLNPGGFLVTFSCSGGINEALFEKIIAGAAVDARVEAKIIARLHQAADHPVALNFPEGAYLKGFVIAT